MTKQIPYYEPQSADQLSANFFQTKLKGLYYFQTKKFNDERGFFAEIAKTPEIEKIIGQKFTIKQLNLAKSQSNVVRGLHAEAWNKLVTVISGEIFTAIVDIRPTSPTFKQKLYFKLGFNLTKQTGCGLFISQGLANSICVTLGPVNYLYAVDKLYSERDPSQDKAISLFDPQLNLDWPLPKEEMIISARDQQALNLADWLKATDKSAKKT